MISINSTHIASHYHPGQRIRLKSVLISACVKTASKPALHDIPEGFLVIYQTIKYIKLSYRAINRIAYSRAARSRESWTAGRFHPRTSPDVSQVRSDPERQIKAMTSSESHQLEN